jgi:peptidoglycan-associated lipoprotein
MNNPIKNGCALLLVMLLSISGCGKRKQVEKNTQKTKAPSEIAMPITQSDEVKSVFDDDLAEFALIDEAQTADNSKVTHAENCLPDQENEEDLVNEFSWIEDEEKRNESLKTVYFDFDKYAIKADQEEVVSHNTKTIKEILTQKSTSKNIVVVEGHACSSAGSAAYNMALSEKRAKVFADHLTKAGIPQNQVKIVGRGQECPVRDGQGRPLTGNRTQQALNRRDEINIVHA